VEALQADWYSGRLTRDDYCQARDDLLTAYIAAAETEGYTLKCQFCSRDAGPDAYMHNPICERCMGERETD
jgi:hypothetical protein